MQDRWRTGGVMQRCTGLAADPGPRSPLWPMAKAASSSRWISQSGGARRLGVAPLSSRAVIDLPPQLQLQCTPTPTRQQRSTFYARLSPSLLQGVLEASQKVLGTRKVFLRRFHNLRSNVGTNGGSQLARDGGVVVVAPDKNNNTNNTPPSPPNSRRAGCSRNASSHS
jgi:hypothetical protein